MDADALPTANDYGRIVIQFDQFVNQYMCINAANRTNWRSKANCRLNKSYYKVTGQEEDNEINVVENVVLDPKIYWSLRDFNYMNDAHN